MSQDRRRKPRVALTYALPGQTDERVYYPLLYPRAGQTIRATIINSELVGILTHWRGGRTQPCLSGVGDCEGCVQGCGQRWKGYLGAVSQLTGRKVLLEVTKYAFENCPELQVPGQDLRGRTVETYRAGRSKQSPLCIKLYPAGPVSRLPKPIDMQEALTRIWGLYPYGTSLTE